MGILEPLLRGFEGEHDLEDMFTVSNASMLADSMGMIHDFDTFLGMYAGFMETLPSASVLVAEQEGKIVGHAMVWWRDVAGGHRLYSHQSSVLPEYACIRERLMDWAERRLAEIALGHRSDASKMLETQAVPGTALDAIVKCMGYVPSRHFFEMVGPLDAVPAAVAPEGITITPLLEHSVREAWAVSREAFMDHWCYSEKNWSNERLEEIIASPLFDLSLWFIAVADGRVVGSVRNYIKPDENAILGRKRGYISNLCVLRPWRRRGIASALLSKSMAGLASRGLTEARLTVDSERTTGALSLYTKAGFSVSNTYVNYWKLLAEC